MTRSTEAPLISVVVPNCNGVRFLERCLISLRTQTRQDFEVLVVDNASDDTSIETAARVLPQARILRNERNLGFAGGVNAGLRVSRGEWIAVLNNDTEVAPDWVSACAAAINRFPDAEFFACRILELKRRDTVYSAGDCFLRAGIGYRRGQEQPDGPAYDAEIPVFSACGCAALYRRSLLTELNGYDERLFAYLEDVELGLRIRTLGHAGYYVPQARVYHFGSGTGGGEFSALGVRLRTRNSLLLLTKSIPARILCRMIPMIAAAQLWWFLRAVRHGRFVSYLRGVGQAVILAPSMFRSRRQLRRLWGADAVGRLWHAILLSEALARRDYLPAPAGKSSGFLKWYFGFFDC